MGEHHGKSDYLALPRVRQYVLFQRGGGRATCVVARRVYAHYGQKRARKDYGNLRKTFRAEKQGDNARFFFQSRRSSNNIRYDLCGVEVKKLLDAEGKIVEEKYIGEKVKESVEASGEKWVSAIQKEGIVAFDAMFFCPKTQKIKQGMYLSVRWKENEDKAYVYPNKCEECSSAMILIDDENIGFMHEDCRTIGHCEKCRVPLVVEKVSFKVPQQEAQ